MTDPTPKCSPAPPAAVDKVSQWPRQWLTPAAQAVIDAAMNTPMGGSYEGDIAAALRAAADQIAPEAFEYNSGYCTNQAMDFELGQECRNEEIRKKLLAIAAEIDAI